MDTLYRFLVFPASYESVREFRVRNRSSRLETASLFSWESRARKSEINVCPSSLPPLSLSLSLSSFFLYQSFIEKHETRDAGSAEPQIEGDLNKQGKRKRRKQTRRVSKL